MSNKFTIPSDMNSQAFSSEGRGVSSPLDQRSSGKLKEKTSYLIEETFAMEQQRRRDEIKGHRQFAKVHEREHTEEQQRVPEGELLNNIKEHLWLESQVYDGADPDVNSRPSLNPEADAKLDNARREQEKEKQHRLGLMPKMGTAPKPEFR